MEPQIAIASYGFRKGYGEASTTAGKCTVHWSDHGEKNTYRFHVLQTLIDFIILATSVLFVFQTKLRKAFVRHCTSY